MDVSPVEMVTVRVRDMVGVRVKVVAVTTTTTKDRYRAARAAKKNVQSSCQSKQIIKSKLAESIAVFMDRNASAPPAIVNISLSYTDTAFQWVHCNNCTLRLMFYCVCFIYPHLSWFSKCTRRRNCKLQRHHQAARQFLSRRHIREIIIKFHCHVCNRLSLVLLTCSILVVTAVVTVCQ